MNKNMHEPGVLRFRRSPAPLALKIIIGEILLEMFYLFAKILLYLLEEDGVIGSAGLISTILTILLIPMAIIIIVVPFAVWVSEEFIIKDDEIVVKRGVITSRQTAYPYTNMQRIQVRQGLVGKIFNFGTVRVYVPVLGQEIAFSELSRPHEFAEILKSMIPNSSQGQFLLRKN